MGRMVRRAAGRRPEQQPAGKLSEHDPDADHNAKRGQPRPEPAQVGAPQQGTGRATDPPAILTGQLLRPREPDRSPFPILMLPRPNDTAQQRRLLEL